MKISAKWLSVFIVALAVLSLATSAAAQSGEVTPFQMQGGGRGGAVPPTGAAPKIAAGGVLGGFEPVYTGPPVTGRPYSAQVVTESVQTLADGNQITHKNSSPVYRDSQGRMRREQTLPLIGPYPPTDPPPYIISIDDPIANTHWQLVPGKKFASQTLLKRSGNSNTLSPKAVLPIVVGEPLKVVTEDLGVQTMEGLTVTGTRITRTIPAGEIGNEKPILVVTEKWYSEDLQITIMTRHSDPRTGTTTMSLTKVSRSEPDPSLFIIPPDYTVKTLSGTVN